MVGFAATAQLETVRGTLSLAQSLGFTAQFASARLVHPQVKASLGAASVSGNVRGQKLETRFNLPSISASAQGETAKITASGSLGFNLEQPLQNWRGQLNSKIVGRDFAVNTSGDWQNLRLTGNLPTRLSSLAAFILPNTLQSQVAIDGTLGLPELRYNLGLFAKLAGLNLAATLKGQNNNFAARVDAKDASDGTGTLTYTSSGTASVQLSNLDLSALAQTSARVSGVLQLQKQALRGQLTGNIAGLPIVASWLENDSFRGSVGGSLPVQIRATTWRFPLDTILDLKTGETDLPLRATARFNVATLRGQGRLEVLPYSQALGSGAVTLQAQSMPFEVALDNGLRLRLQNKAGSLRLAADAWQGEIGVAYTAFGVAGTALARASGKLLELETTGLVQLRGSGTLEKAGLTGRLALQPLLNSLPKDLQTGLKAGVARIEATWNAGSLNFKTSLENTRFFDDMVRLSLAGQWKNSGYNAKGDLSVGRSLASFTLGDTGLNASKLDLDLRLARFFGLDLTGRVTGRVALLNYDLAKLEADISLQKVRGFGATADGVLQATNGNLRTQLRGSTPLELEYTLAGALYPKLDAAINLGQLSGRATGTRLEFTDRRLNLNLQGMYRDKASQLELQIGGDSISASANWDAAKLQASGLISSQSATGNLEIADLQGLAGVAGNASAKLEWRDNILFITQILANAAGYKANATAKYAAGVLNVEQFAVAGADFSASGRGQLLPKLEAKGTAVSTFNFAPANLTWSAAGTLEQPQVRAGGVLQQASLGLIAPNTGLDAQFDGQRWRLQLAGTALSGFVEGGLSFISSADLSVNAPIIYLDNRLQATGTLAWNNDAGFLGNLAVNGKLFGQAGKLQVVGDKQLTLSSTWRDLNLKATLPAQIGAALNAKLELARVDVGAFFEKPQTIWLEGSGSASGQWATPTLDFNGTISSADTVLDSSLTVQYNNNAANLTLAGKRLDAKARWQNGAWQAAANAQNIALEKYLPASLLPSQLEQVALTGRFSASGENFTVWQVAATDLDVAARVAQFGAVRATGTATLSSETLQTTLRLEALGGQTLVQAKIDNPLEFKEATLVLDATLQKLDASQPKLENLELRGLVSGNLKLEGKLLDPTLSAELELEKAGLQAETWQVSSSLLASGRLLSPSLSGQAVLSGSGQGNFVWAAENVLSNAPKVLFDGTAEIPLGAMKGKLEGSLPNLSGSLEFRAAQLPETLQIRATGDGAYAVSSQNFANGSVQLSATKSWLESALGGQLRLKTNADFFVKNFAAPVTGDVLLSGKLLAPQITLQNTTLTRREGTVLAAGMVYPDLDLRGTAQSVFEYAPARLEYSVRGSFAKPDVRLTGLLGTAQVGLIAPDTKLEGVFDGTNWQVNLAGEAISGVVTGTLSSLAKVNLNLNAPLLYADNTVTALGTALWDEKNGFGGDLTLTGRVLGQDTKLELRGNNSLEAQLLFASGQLRATLPNPTSQKLNATWDFAQFDIGALWQKPAQLFVAGSGKVGGTWAAPQIEFDGGLDGKNNSLDATLSATYAAGVVRAALTGKQTKLEGVFENGVWSAQGSLEKVSVAALLPSLVQRLETSLQFSASGDATGLEVSLAKLSSTADLETYGAVSATGAAQVQAQYGKNGLTGNLEVNNLAVTALGGKAVLDGKLGNTNSTINLNLERLNLEPLGLQGLVSGRLDLGGQLGDPEVLGKLQGTGLGLKNEAWTADAALELGRRLLNPEIIATVDLQGTASGRVNLVASDIFSNQPNLDVRGNAKLPFVTAQGTLSGRFPSLKGTVDVLLPSLPSGLRQVQLTGLGDNQWRILIDNALQGQLRLTPAATLLSTGVQGELRLQTRLENSGLLDGANGLLDGDLQVSGELQNPQANFSGTLQKASLGGVQLGNASITAVYNNTLSGLAKFQNGELKLEADRLTATNIPLEVVGVKALLNATGRITPFDLSFSSNLSGTATGTAEGRLVGNQLGLKFDLLSNGVRAIANASADSKNGWSGQVKLTGLPKAAPISLKTLTGTAEFALGGAFAAPTLTGKGDLYGAKFALSSSLSPLKAKLRLSEAGSGTINLENNALSGAITFSDETLQLELATSGSLSIPVATLRAKVGQFSASSKLRFEQGEFSATLDLSDGSNTGQFRLEAGRIIGAIGNLSLSSTGLAGYGGNFEVSADLTQDPSSDFGWKGSANAVWNNLKTPLEIPSLGWKIDGSGNATLSTSPVRVLLEYKGTAGLAEGDLIFKKGLWQGDLDVDLRGAEGKGAVQGIIRADEKGITGDLTAQNLPLAVSGIKATVSGKVNLNGDSFSVAGKGATLGGNVKLDGDGGIADLVPLLETYTKSPAGDLPPKFNVVLNTVRLEDIAQIRAIAPYLKGKVSGALQVVGDFTNFQLTRLELSLPDQNGQAIALVAREVKINAAGSFIRYSGKILDGSSATLSDANVNLSGVGESLINGTFDGKVATGTLALSRAPLHALVAAVLGEMPGTAYATGFARYSVPVDNLLAATVKMDFVPLEVSGGGDTLTGKGRLIYSNGNLQFDDLILRGKGEWRINGNYATDKVDLAMSFKDTVFTPLLDLIPTLKEYDPRATGSLELQLSGRYGKPDAKVSLKNLSGSIGGIQLTAKELLGTLENGALQVRGLLTSDDSLGATLDTTANAKLVSYTPIQLEDLEALAKGSLNIKPIGLISNINARAYGDSGGFKLDLSGKKGGDLTIRGDLSPRIKLKLEGRALVMPIPDYFIADSLLDAALTFTGDGGRFYDVAGQLNIARLQAQLQQKTSSPQSAPLATPKPNPFLQQVRFRGVQINAPQGLRVSESFATLEAGGKLLATGTMANPEFSGALEAIGGSGGRGTVRLGINNYTIQTAVATFSPIEGIFPIIEVKSRGTIKASCNTKSTPSTTETKDISIALTIRVRWIADSKNANAKRIDAQPLVEGNCPDTHEPLQAAQLYALVTLGSSNANFSGLAQQSLDTVLSVFILSELSRQIKAATGIDIDFKSNLIEVVAQNISDPNAQAVINFTVNFGIDLSRAVRLNVQLNNNRRDDTNKNQLLGGAVNLNWQSDDGRFGIRFGTPFYFPSANQEKLGVFDIIQPEAQFSFNLSNTWALSTTLGIPAGNNFRISFGVILRF